MKVLEKTNEVILSREEYEALIERIEELEDIIIIHETEGEESRPFDHVLKDLGIDVST
ncbi:MAG: hypothetical protein IEMM0008_0442 [bacterium]|nr:MAG: hypothetical protein IEMM0008_0442 [bacterium]